MLKESGPGLGTDELCRKDGINVAKDLGLGSWPTVGQSSLMNGAVHIYIYESSSKYDSRGFQEVQRQYD
jgi:hypothetical protein